MEKLGLKHIPNHEVIIYVETANAIFQKCLSVAGLSEKRNMLATLADAILNRYADSPIDADFIRNKKNDIKHRLASGGAFQEIVFRNQYLYTLAMFAGIPDYVNFNKNYGPLNIQVMFTPRPFKYLELLRIPQHGNLKQIDDKWMFTNQDGEVLSGNVTACEIFTMPGDRSPHWVKVSYDDNAGNTIAAYFGEEPEPLPTTINLTSAIVVFFNNLKRP